MLMESELSKERIMEVAAVVSGGGEKMTVQQTLFI